jgi:hypothetical protein
MTPSSLPKRCAQRGDSQETLLSKLVGSSLTGTLLVSAARTASTSTASIDLSGFRSLILFLNISAASGTGGLRLTVEYQDPISGLWRTPLVVPSTAVTSVQMVPVFVGPGIGAIGSTASFTAGGMVSLPLTSAMRVTVSHGDASSYTYSLGYEAT